MAEMKVGYIENIVRCKRLCLLFFFLVCFNFTYGQREIVLNTTGYGLDKNAENGINPQQWSYIKKFIGLKYGDKDATPTCIRLHVQWEQYESSLGVYSGEKLKAAVKAITELAPNMKVALHFPYQRGGGLNDSYFSDPEELAKTYNGTILQNQITYTYPSMYSESAKARYYNFVKHALSQLTTYYPKILYVAMGNSTSEEYISPIYEDNGYTEWGFYDKSSRRSWLDQYFKMRFPGATSFVGKEPVIPQAVAQPLIDSNDVDKPVYPPNGGYWNTTEGKELHRFAGWGLLMQFKQFYEAVKSVNSGINVIYFISDFGSQQGNIRFLHNSTIPLAMDLADGVYTSDGNNIYDLWRKIAGVDAAKGTQPNKVAGIEFDPVDLGQVTPGGGIDQNLADEWFDRAFKHGANYIHIAMHFHDNEIQQLAKAIANNREKYITNAFTPPTPVAPIEQNLYPKVFGSEYLFPDWSKSGQNWSITDNKPTFIKMTDDGYWENLWENNDYLPCDFSLNLQNQQPLVRPSQGVTLNVNCTGAECDRMIVSWSGQSVNQDGGNSLNFNAPSQDGVYNYVATIKRSGCTTRTISTSINVQAPLPVKLADFSGKTSERSVILNWETTEEINSDRFEIERSGDAKTWTKLGVVATNSFAGVSNYYHFEDTRPSAGQNFYRLKMVDLDQTYGYSRTINVKVGFDSGFTLYPNPVRERIFVSDENWPNIDKVELYNLNGNRVFLNDQVVDPEIDISQLKSDSYILNLIYKDGNSTSKKFVKE